MQSMSSAMLGVPTFADATLCFSLLSMVATPIYDHRQPWVRSVCVRATKFTSDESTSWTILSSPDGAAAGGAAVTGAGSPDKGPAPFEWFSPFSGRVKPPPRDMLLSARSRGMCGRKSEEVLVASAMLAGRGASGGYTWGQAGSRLER